MIKTVAIPRFVSTPHDKLLHSPAHMLVSQLLLLLGGYAAKVTPTTKNDISYCQH